jgi:hypothetical protein
MLLSQKLHGFEIFRQSSSALAQLKEYAKNVIEFLQRAYYIKIDEIVLDFIKDR